MTKPTKNAPKVPQVERDVPLVATDVIPGTHSDYNMIWGVFSLRMDRSGLHFLHKNETMSGIKYIGV